MTNHQSATLLFVTETGSATAMASANYLTGARIGASSATATRHLSRPDARGPGIYGAGEQATYQVLATLAPLISSANVRGSIGAVIGKTAQGRLSDDEITIFDGTGVALQDPMVAGLAVRLARENGLGATVD